MIDGKLFLAQELKLALSSLLRLPSFSLIVITTLAFTLSALAVVFNINYLVLTKPLPYPDADKLVVTDQSETINGVTQYGFQILSAQFHIYQDQTYIEEMALMQNFNGKLRDVPLQPSIDAIQVTPEYFSLLGMPMLLGRHFNQKEGLNERQRVVILSYEAWQQHFNGDPGVVDQQTRIGNESYKIVGVAAPEFEAPEVFGNFAIQAWVSFHQEVSTTTHWEAINNGINGIAKLKTGVTLEQASASLGQQMNALYLGQQGVAPDTSIGGRFILLKEKIIGNSDEMAFILLAGVVTLLFIAVTNISNLFFSRAVQKQKVMAIQAALGAQPKHLFAGMLSEALILILVAWVLGLVLAGWMLLWLQNDLQFIFPRMQNLSLDTFTIVASGIISVLIAMVMAMLATRQLNYEKLTEDLQVSGKGTSSQISGRTRNFLVATQVSLATLLLLGATEILSPVYKKLTQSLGFEIEDVYHVRVDSGTVENGIFEYSQQIKQALIGSPEVEDAARTLLPPMITGWEDYLFDANNNTLGIVSKAMFDSNIFSVMGHDLLEGRTFSEIKQQDAIPQEIIISESLAKRLFNGQSAIGKTLQATQNEPLTVVGLVNDIYIPGGERDYALERYYIPYPGYRLSFTLKLNSTLERDKLLNILQSVNPSFSISEFYSLSSDVEARLRQTKLIGILTLSLVSLSLCLAAAGIYGVLNYTVQMRRFELGIHLSVGAHTHKLITTVVKQSMMPVVFGIGLGLGLAFLLYVVGSRFWIYQLRADSILFVLALPLMGIIAALACYLPVKKVMTADPIKALRNE
jgi:predicted permease